MDPSLLSSFIASLSLWLVYEKVRSHWRGIDKLYGLYLLQYVTLMGKCMYVYMCLIVSSVKFITKRLLFIFIIQTAELSDTYVQGTIPICYKNHY